MIRDFSEDRKEKLKKQIDEINSETLCWLTDGLGDLGTRFSRWIGILDINNYMDNISAYHKKMLDMNDMTKKEIDQIFEEVYSVDSEFKKKFGEVSSMLDTWIDNVHILRDQINPGFSIAPAASIRKDCKEINKKLETARGEIAETYDKELTYSEKRAALEAAKGSVSALGEFAGNILAMPGKMISGVLSGDYAEIVSAEWDLINSMFSFGQKAAAFTAVGLGIGIGSLSGKNKNKVREKALEESESLNSRDGLTGEFESLAQSGTWEKKIYGGLAKGSGALDDINSMYKVYEDAKGMTDTFQKENFTKDNIVHTIGSELGFETKITPDDLERPKYMRKAKWKRYNDMYKDFERDKNIYSNIHTVLDYGLAAADPKHSVGEEVFKKSSVGGFVSDEWSTIKDLGDMEYVAVN